MSVAQRHTGGSSTVVWVVVLALLLALALGWALFGDALIAGTVGNTAVGDTTGGSAAQPSTAAQVWSDAGTRYGAATANVGASAGVWSDVGTGGHR